MESATEPQETKRLSMDLNPSIASPHAIPSPSLPNGNPPALNGDHVSRPQSRSNRLSSPKKELTNTLPPNIPPLPAASTPAALTKAHRIPYPPRTKTALDQIPLHRPVTPQSPIETMPSALGLRRRSSHIQSTPVQRRNSFPSTRKDSLEILRALRAEAKIAREKATSNLPQPSKKRKHSLTTPVPGIPGTQSTGVDGYFPGKPLVGGGKNDVRSRSSTTPGRDPSFPGVLRNGSYIAGSAPYMGSRIENIRRESTRSAVGEMLPSTLWDYLMLEMENQEVQEVEGYKSERLANFLRIPEKFEKVSSSLVVRGLMVVNLVWMGGLFGFVFAYVYDFTVESYSDIAYTSTEQVSEKSFGKATVSPSKSLLRVESYSLLRGRIC